jgi:hypothetical protein
MAVLNINTKDWIKFPSVLKKEHTVYKFYQVFFSYRINQYLMDISGGSYYSFFLSPFNFDIPSTFIISGLDFAFLKSIEINLAKRIKIIHAYFHF